MSGDATKASRRKDTRPLLSTMDVSALFSQAAPFSAEAEMSLLGSILLDPNTIADVEAAGCKPEAFYTEKHRAIYEAIIGLPQAHRGDLVRVMEALRDREMLEQVGGSDFLLELANSTPMALHAGHYAEIVAANWARRRLIDASTETIYDTLHNFKGGLDGVRELIDRGESRVFAISGDAEASSAPATLSQLLAEAVDRTEAAAKDKTRPILTGFTDFDRMTGGLGAGEMIVLAARPSMGKSALALNLLENVVRGVTSFGRGDSSAQEPIPCLLFSLEMNKDAIAARFICSHARVPMHVWKRGMLKQEEWDRVVRASISLEGMSLICDDTPTLTITQLRSRARRAVAKHGVRLIAVDYLQLMSGPASSESRQVEVSDISRGLKALARELRVPILVMAQLNRQVEQRENKRPRMSDLRESGSVEQDADLIALLHREEYYHTEDESWIAKHPEAAGKAELIIAKQRNGPTGIVHLDWNAEATRFSDDTGATYAEARTTKKPAPKPQQKELPLHDDSDDDDDTRLPV